MKCDELKQVENPIEWGLYYDKSEVDAAIAELKEALQESENAWFEAGADAADYYQENRRLKRALWIARAERAHSIILLWNVYCYQNNSLYYRDFLNIKCNPFRNLTKKTAMEWSDLWKSIETKLRAKAKEYK